MFIFDVKNLKGCISNDTVRYRKVETFNTYILIKELNNKMIII